MISVSSAQLMKAQKELQFIPNGAKKAITRAINRSAQAARTEVTKQIRNLYYIKYNDVLYAIKIKQASADQKTIMAKVNVRGTRRELMFFRVSPKTLNTKSRPKVLQVAVKKDGGLKPLPSAFVNRGSSSGALHVLQRVGKSRYPINIKYGPSVPEMANNKNIRKAVEDRANEILATRLDHEIERLLGG